MPDVERRLLVALLVATVALSSVIVLVAGPKPSSPPPPPGSGVLVIYHWWTAGGEKQAIEAIISAFKRRYPGIEVVENPVPGGAGVTMRAVIRALIVTGKPPDVFQVHAGAELKEYVDRGFLLDLTTLWEKYGLSRVLPKVLRKMVTIDGRVYAVPINIHRANWLWYNKRIFDELGLKPPRTLRELLEVCRKIKAAGYWPIALGSRNKWPITHLFENILLAVGGPEAYIEFFTGRITADDVRVRLALEYMKELLPYIYPYHSELTWDQACALLVQGKAAMTIMGDWALGYFLASGWKYGVDFAAVPAPGTQGYFIMLSDSFAIPRGAKHVHAAEKWIEFIAEKDVQLRFNLIKGSIAARLDVPPSAYPDPVRRADAEDLKSKLVVPSAVHGGLAPSSFMANLNNILYSFLYTGNVEAAIEQIDQAMKLTNLSEFWKGRSVEDFIGWP